MNRLPVCLLLDNVRSLYNVGSLFRLGDGARCERILLAGITGTPAQAGLRKTALGAEKSVPWEYHVSSLELARRLQNAGYQLVVLERVTLAKVYWEVRYRFPLCLVVGSETSGVAPEMMDLADEIIEVPMSGEKESLNVAMSAGIAVYEMVRQHAQMG